MVIPRPNIYQEYIQFESLSKKREAADKQGHFLVIPTKLVLDSDRGEPESSLPERVRKALDSGFQRSDDFWEYINFEFLMDGILHVPSLYGTIFIWKEYG
ncbi:MAG: hypothetical protein DRN37_03090 [Thermoplasmata archaeon]|nr:MAG: hypothetical protein DRN37_03090 [Thermoplasmata archaeon]